MIEHGVGTGAGAAAKTAASHATAVTILRHCWHWADGGALTAAGSEFLFLESNVTIKRSA